MMVALGDDHGKENMMVLYKKLGGCLAQNKMFLH
jgi:hypothetical protein